MTTNLMANPAYEKMWETHTKEGTAAFQEGRYDEAQQHLQSAVALAEALDPAGARVATSLNNLACLYTAQEKYDEAGPLHQRALATMEQAQGRMHPDVAPILKGYAQFLRKTNREDEAKNLERRVRIIES